MAEILDAAIISLDGAATGATARCVIDYDWEGNMYGTEDGEAVTVTSFYLEEDIDLLLQPPPGYKIATITKTSGRVDNLGLTTRTVEVTDDFFENDDEKSLSWYPNTTLSISDRHSGVNAALTVVEDNKVTCDPTPVILDYSYGISAYMLKCKHDVNVELEDDESWPMGIIVEVEAI